MSQQQKVPFVDLVSQHIELEKELVEVFRNALRQAAFIGGKAVEDFEREFGRFCSTEHCVGVSSGTDALRFALMAAGVKPGDIVLTVPMTFIATTEAITQCGARADFVDVNPETYTMDPAQLESYIRAKCVKDSGSGALLHREMRKPITAIVPVHLYGQIADMDAILDIASKNNLIVVEDACQAHGAEYFSARQDRWCKAGSMGKAAAFSFYPGKNLGACGEGGAVTTNDETIANKVRMIRDHGQSRKYHHEIEGYNGRLDSIQAGILRVKLDRLKEWNDQRRLAAGRYRELLASMKDSITLPCEPAWSKSIYHLFVILTGDRDKLIRHLTASGIGCGIHYPIPVHLQAPYRVLGYREGDFPISEKIASEGVSLPMFPQLTSDQQNQVADTLGQFASEAIGANEVR